MQLIKPKEPVSVLALVQSLEDLGLSQWHEVVYHDGDEWQSYQGSSTFSNGEQVVSWGYINNSPINITNCNILAIQAEIEGMKSDNDLRRLNEESPAYSGNDFFDKANELRCIADEKQ